MHENAFALLEEPRLCRQFHAVDGAQGEALGSRFHLFYKRNFFGLKTKELDEHAALQLRHAADVEPSQPLSGFVGIDLFAARAQVLP